MSDVLQKYSKFVLGKVLKSKRVISGKEFAQLSEEEKKDYEYFGGEYVGLIPMDIPEEERDEFIKLAKLEALNSIRQDMNVIKIVMIALLALLAIGIFLNIAR